MDQGSAALLQDQHQAEGAAAEVIHPRARQRCCGGKGDPDILAAALIPERRAPEAGAAESDPGGTMTPTHHEGRRLLIRSLPEFGPVALIRLEVAAFIGQSRSSGIAEARLAADSMQASQGGRHARCAMGETQKGWLAGGDRPAPLLLLLRQLLQCVQSCLQHQQLGAGPRHTRLEHQLAGNSKMKILCCRCLCKKHACVI